MNYYNEFDPNAAAWLRQLIGEGLIPPGEVDQRSITDVLPTDLTGFTQCHFFAGIGGWSLALQLAGWPADKPVWTGSCPCQPFSVAGKGKGQDDERHLWPAFFDLIRQCRPERVFGEQVADAIGKGWLDDISTDLEGEGYACGSVVLGAHSVGADHIRKRLYWVADSSGTRVRRDAGTTSSEEKESGGEGFEDGELDSHRLVASGSTVRLADSLSPRLQRHGRHGDYGHESRWNGTQPVGSTATCCSACGRVDDGERERCAARGNGDHAGNERQQSGADVAASGMGDATLQQCGRAWEYRTINRRSSQAGRSSAGNSRLDDSPSPRCDREIKNTEGAARSETRLRVPCEAGGLNQWSDSRWIKCRDGKHRRIPTEPALFPLADGLPYKLARRGSVRPALLKGAGNAIVPQVAAAFITAFLDK